MIETKLDGGQKHILRLIVRDKKEDGWTTISSQLYKTLSAKIPSELAVFEPLGDAGRARLTDAGQGVINAMAWL